VKQRCTMQTERLSACHVSCNVTFVPSLSCKQPLCVSQSIYFQDSSLCSSHLLELCSRDLLSAVLFPIRGLSSSTSVWKASKSVQKNVQGFYCALREGYHGIVLKLFLALFLLLWWQVYE
jgi:hypothetical protein